MSLAWGTNTGFGQEYNSQMSQALAQTTNTEPYPYGYGQLNAHAPPWPSGNNYGGGYFGIPGTMYQQTTQMPQGLPQGLPPGAPQMPPGLNYGMPMQVPQLMAPPPAYGNQTHPPREGTQLGGLLMHPPPTKPIMPRPQGMPDREEPNVETAPGIDAEWMQQHAERVGLLLSLPENDVNFSTEEVQTAVKTCLMDLEIVDPGKIDVTSRGRTGPYEIILSRDERTAILSQGEVDIFQHTGDEEERTFRAYETDQFGNVVQSEKAQTAAFNEADRAARLRKNAAAAEDRKGTQLRIFMDGTSQSAALEEGKRNQFFAAAMQKLRVMIDARCHTKPLRMALIAVKDAFGNEMNKGVIFISLPKGTNGPEWVASIRWDSVKWIHMGQSLLPVKIRMENKMLASVGLKQCCFLPHCRSVPCTALSDAYDLAGVGRAKRGYRSEHEPSWEQEKAQRRQDSANRAIEAKEKADAAVARRHAKVCRQWKAGRCHKAACPYTHGTTEEASAIDCSHGAACNRTGCPFRHGADEP